jgi:hypothetical protein
MDWINDYDDNSSPSLAAIDELVESTGMKPSQIVACTVELVDELRSSTTCVLMLELPWK